MAKEEKVKRDDGMAPMQTPAMAKGLLSVAQQREIAEVQSKMIIARMNPRDRIRATERIVQECTRKSLAVTALYTYSRGGTDITGETIRLAEVIAQNWGNFEFGIREIEKRDENSTVEAYAWDLETNVSQRKTFQVGHIRYSNEKGAVKLSDPRDIYEMVANQGARRMRACILSVIPGDVREAAIKQCERTLKTHIDVTPERVKNMAAMFLEEFKVTKAMIEKRIQRRMEAMTPGLMVSLTKVYNSLKDGMSSPEEWFDVEGSPPQTERGALKVEDLKPKEEEKASEGSGEPQGSADDTKAQEGKEQPTGFSTAEKPASQDEGKDQKERTRRGGQPPDRMFPGLGSGAGKRENLFGGGRGREPGEDDQ